MDKYTIYCTEEQTKKALELGASIKPKIELFTPNLNNTPHCHTYIDGEDVILFIPTAEQMRGWLEDIFHIQIDVIFRVIDYDWGVRDMYDTIISQSMHVESRPEATLAAIDAALDYLTNSKK